MSYTSGAHYRGFTLQHPAGEAPAEALWLELLTAEPDATHRLATPSDIRGAHELLLAIGTGRPQPTPVPAIGLVARLHWQQGSPWRRYIRPALLFAALADRPTASPWGPGTPADLPMVNPWARAQPLDPAPRFGWHQAIPQDAHTISLWAATVPSDRQLMGAWDHSITPRDRATGAAYQDARWADLGARGRWFSVNPHSTRPVYPRDLVPPLLRDPATQLRIPLGADWQPQQPDAIEFAFGRGREKQAAYTTDAHSILPWGIGTPLDPNNILPWGAGNLRDRWTPLPWENQQPLPMDPVPGPNNQRSYQLMNNVAIYALPSLTPLWVDNITLSRDIDTAAWQFTGDLRGEGALAHIKPDGTGHKHLQVNINGWQWVIMVEGYQRALETPGEVFRLTGKSRTAYLGAPHAPLRSRLFTTDIAAQQILNEELQGTGFSVEWRDDAETITSPFWVIAGGSYSYTGLTPLEVLGQVAQAVGAVLVPHRTDDKLILQPRYLVSPWQLATMNVNAIRNHIAANQIRTPSSTLVRRPQYDSVYLAGTVAGVAVNAIRAGQPGSLPAPDLYDVLHQDTTQAVERARNILSDTGDHYETTLVTPLFPPGSAPELCEPGEIVAYNDPKDNSHHRGYCLSTSISVQAPVVSQTITLEVPDGHS